MSSIRRIAAFLLVTLWLPALLHCRLEAAGMLFESECCSPAPDAAVPVADHGCAGDSCEVIEGEFTSPAAFTVKAPALGSCACLICCPAIAPLAEFLPPAVSEVALAAAAPPELARAWVLLVPGTISPRAP